MPRFLTGDELGSIKSVSYNPNESAENISQLKTLYDGTSMARTRGKSNPMNNAQDKLASAHADGSVCLASLTDEDQLERRGEWKETRVTPGQTFVGLASTQNCVYSCTSNGALRLTAIGEEAGPTHSLGALPLRLTDWRLGPNQKTFAYGGDEVEVSVWNTERAFAPQHDNLSSASASQIEGGKKRKRGDALFPGEIWRAKNVPNDYLGLRQPVHNTCLTYISSSSSETQQQLLVGTRLGDLRRYDTRSGRRPVNDFKGIGKVGGVRSVEKGFLEHQVFVSDQGTNLFALDLRNGGIIYGYKGISGAVNSAAAAPSFLASVSLDRYIRIHSTFPPPAEVGQQQEEKGTVLHRVYMTTAPTVVIWDQSNVKGLGETDEEDGDIWEKMKHVGENDQE
ncbi:hypothetical protein PAXRUDRAFT_12812 [Paxillus rubicundulus Ve08.2h10]|uniref:Ribosome biogenesis protein NSA1 n=1 Tax=Paxillus rubicundulus Ve08.2h10 TaxID=930991 RepID=A0A0D0E0B3_9AGAM|nr:hypothetical protein PAXRUDRAFT_12812 [Paxillus rubicundulus Ve08.2h10]